MKKEDILKRWISFFENKQVKKEIYDQYIVYIDSLLTKNVPIILNFDHLCQLLGRTNEYLSSVINSSENHYREFEIKKRSGSKRIISSPYPALLETQYWIFDNILKTIQVNPSAHGFVYKKSIITNSILHKDQKELLKLDLVNFFPSININRIIFVFKQLGYSSNIAFYLAALCTLDNSLPQGAPTSPILSNIIARRLDSRLIKLSKRFGLRYSRYADDLTFSGNSIPAKYIQYVKQIINEEGFAVNENKTRLYKSIGKRIVTGISVAGGTIKVPREYKRKLKLELNFIKKFGLESHISKKKIRKPNYLLSLIGKVNFWISVEPNNKYAHESKNMLSKYLIDLRS